MYIVITKDRSITVKSIQYQGRVRLITVSILIFLILAAWYIAYRNHFFLEYYTVKRFSCGNGYSVVVSAENSDRNAIYCQLFLQGDPKTPKAWIDAFLRPPQKVSFEIRMTSDHEVVGLIDADKAGTLYAVFDLKNEQVWTYTESAQPVKLIRRLEAEYPETSEIIHSFRKLKDVKNGDSDLRISVIPTNKSIRFTLSQNNKILFDFPVERIYRAGFYGESQISRYTSSPASIERQTEAETIIDNEQQERLSDLLDQWGLQYEWLYSQGYDSDGVACFSLKSMVGRFELAEKEYSAFLSAVAEEVFQLSDNYRFLIGLRHVNLLPEEK
ncbi:MAG: hypothetical protein JW828_01165 [Sedimentisphaerales bacterium]|nr:hypothetical protein [Sedimentisphaerales bacterium]